MPRATKRRKVEDRDSAAAAWAAAAGAAAGAAWAAAKAEAAAAGAMSAGRVPPRSQIVVRCGGLVDIGTQKLRWDTAKVTLSCVTDESLAKRLLDIYYSSLVPGVTLGDVPDVIAEGTTDEMGVKSESEDDFYRRQQLQDFHLAEQTEAQFSQGMIDPDKEEGWDEKYDPSVEQDSDEPAIICVNENKDKLQRKGAVICEMSKATLSVPDPSGRDKPSQDVPQSAKAKGKKLGLQQKCEQQKQKAQRKRQPKSKKVDSRGKSKSQRPKMIADDCRSQDNLNENEHDELQDNPIRQADRLQTGKDCPVKKQQGEGDNVQEDDVDDDDCQENYGNQEVDHHSGDAPDEIETRDLVNNKEQQQQQTEPRLGDEGESQWPATEILEALKSRRSGTAGPFTTLLSFHQSADSSLTEHLNEARPSATTTTTPTTPSVTPATAEPPAFVTAVPPTQQPPSAASVTKEGTSLDGVWNPNNSPPPKFQCPQCPMVFSDARQLSSHSRETHLFPCPEFGCSVSFNKKSTLSQHIRETHSEDVFRCPEKGCTLSFKKRSTLNQHVRLHGNIKPYQCRWCEFAGAQQNNVRSHALSGHKEQFMLAKESKERYWRPAQPKPS